MRGRASPSCSPCRSFSNPLHPNNLDLGQSEGITPFFPRYPGNPGRVLVVSKTDPAQPVAGSFRDRLGTSENRQNHRNVATQSYEAKALPSRQASRATEEEAQCSCPLNVRRLR